MNTKEYRVIFSLDKTNKPASEEQITEMLKDIPNTSLALGSYKGEHERSFVTSSDNMHAAADYARRYNQESILLETGYGVYLMFLNDTSVVKIGEKLVKVAPEVALKQEAWTKIYNNFYIVE